MRWWVLAWFYGNHGRQAVIIDCADTMEGAEFACAETEGAWVDGPHAPPEPPCPG